MIGKTIAHYQITAKLGAGGMGEVYRARDTKLGRDVALKVLPEKLAGDPERRRRFEREARTVAALKHPNIVTIYSVEEAGGRHFITMELVEGQTLSALIARGPIVLERFFDVSIPLADAVSSAHVQNITHRDLKPTNIMIEDSGMLKVLDFGLAKLLDPTADAERSRTLVGTKSDTAVGQIMGTAAYMSPEQAEGKPVDHRSDIFSLGIIFYEMATGERPFKGDTQISTISSILKDHPRHISEVNQTLPRHLGRIVNHCLEKDPEKRFQTTKDIRNEMEELKREIDSGELATEVSGISSNARSTTGAAHVSSTPAASSTSDGARPRRPISRRWLTLGVGALGLALAFLWWSGSDRDVAEKDSARSPSDRVSSGEASKTDARQTAIVFPFENLGPTEDAYFAAGVSEEITSRLAAVSGLRVISRTSAVQYNRSGKTMKQIGEDLGVDYVLEGSVRWARAADGSGRVRITPQLIRVADDSHVWSETYDREVNDIFEVQTDIATRVIDRLGVALLGSERALMEDRPTDNIEAYQAYLQATNLTAPPAEYDVRVVELLERATRLDPKFVAAWYKLAQHHSLMYRDIDRTEERLARAKQAVQGAETIDPEHPMTHLARGCYYYYGFRDYDRALEEFLSASESVPNDSEALASTAYIYRRKGDLDETIERLTRALELDPQNADIASNLAGTYSALRQFDEAIRLYDRAIGIKPDSYEHTMQKSIAYFSWTGDKETALSMLGKKPTEGDLTPYHFSQYWRHWFGRDYGRAIEAIGQLTDDLLYLRVQKKSLVAMAEAQWRGPKAARAALEAAAQLMGDVLAESPSNADFRSSLSIMYAHLGREREAVSEAKLAVDLTAKDLFSGPAALQNLAAVYAILGRQDEAIDLLERLLSTTYQEPITVPVLKADPIWDPLRDHPRFKELVKDPGRV